MEKFEHTTQLHTNKIERIATEKRCNELVEQVKMVGDALTSFGNLGTRGMRMSKFGEYKPEDLDFLEKYKSKDLSRLERLILGIPYDANYQGPQENLMETMDNCAERNPDLYRLYTSICGELIRRHHLKIKEKLEKAVKGKVIDEKLMSELEKRIISLGCKLTPEQISQLRENFKSGNFLLHTAGIDELIAIIESGEILSALEIAKKTKKPWGRGGKEGISFNMNDVRILTGDNKHFVGFVVSPEIILNNQNKLVIPHYAAKFEVQLVSKKYANKMLNADDHDIAHPNEEVDYQVDYLPKVSIEDTFILCSKSDKKEIEKLLASRGIAVRGIITFPTPALRVESWIEDVGDHEKAGELLKKAFKESELNPSISWEKDVLNGPIVIENNRHLSKEAVGKSKIIVNFDEALEVKDSAIYPEEGKVYEL
jgi:hypothetical protein